jgi:hypothetical protein
VVRVMATLVAAAFVAVSVAFNKNDCIVSYLKETS